MAPKVETFDAIWDTGATGPVITQKVVDSCGLVATGIAQVHGVHGVAECETFLVNVALPNNVMVTSVRVTKGDIAGADILIGMDIINEGDFAVTNHNSNTMFSFRTPSLEHIDFVDVVNRENRAQLPDRAERRRAKKRR